MPASALTGILPINDYQKVVRVIEETKEAPPAGMQSTLMSRHKRVHMLTRFADPWLLLLLVDGAADGALYSKKPGSGRIRFSSLAALKEVKQSKTLAWRKGLLFMRCLAMSLFILALARPQAGNRSTEIITEGVDIMLCLDTSGSMNALDFTLDNKRVNRLQVVKKVVEEFVRGRQNDRIGMVVFAEEAFTQCPLTLDYGVLLSFLEKLEIGMAGDRTAIGSALATCVKRLKDLPSKSKIIILLTDGRNNTGSIAPATAADIAKTCGIKVYTIGVGTEGEAPFWSTAFLANGMFISGWTLMRIP